MARGRRRSGSFRRRRRLRADWVYRFDSMSYDAEGDRVPESGLGTYSGSIIGHSVGIAEAQSHILYDSQNYIAHWAAGGDVNSLALAPIFISGAARAEGRRPTILAVEGVVFVIGSDWSLGSELSMGMRIGVFEQSVDTGNFVIDPSYSMWGNPVGAAENNVSIWANNGRNNAWERRPFLRYMPGNEKNYIQVFVRWRGRRRLEPSECFGLYTELEPGSNACQCQYWLRTLVADEG